MRTTNPIRPLSEEGASPHSTGTPSWRLTLVVIQVRALGLLRSPALVLLPQDDPIGYQ